MITLAFSDFNTLNWKVLQKWKGEAFLGYEEHFVKISEPEIWIPWISSDFVT